MARDMGCERIPVTGERDGEDFQTPMFAFQLKVRKMLPLWLWTWLSGVVGKAQETNRVGVLVLKMPGQQDTDALVILRWSDWCDLHGSITAHGARQEEQG